MTYERVMIAIIVVLVVFGVYENWPKDKPSVEVTPAPPKVESYNHPVREGNCWRQFVGTGTKDSILVCH